MPEADLARPDVLRPTVDASQFGVVQRPLSMGERIYIIGAVTRARAIETRIFMPPESARG